LNGKLKMIASMAIWGSMGLVVRWIALPTAAIALMRGALGALFLFLLLTLTGRRVTWRAVRDNLGLLMLSGALLGANWIFLFEAYRRTTVQLATLSYYLAPVLIMAASPLVLKERLTARKVACVLAALAGMALVSGIGTGGAGNLTGILLGLSAAVCYAGLTLTNKFLKGVSPMEATIVQLMVSSAALLPYALVSGPLPLAGTAQPTCDAGLSVTIVPAQICIQTEGSSGSSSTCNAIPGKFVERVTLSGTPGQVHVWQYVDDAPILDVAVAPQYQDSQPNGPGCPPVCRQASLAWTMD
jgi:drug/metabolite transporter (DMT)-like permease